jgi:hypothetical protein
MAPEAFMQNPHATLTRLSAAALLGFGSFAATACTSGTPVAAAPSTSMLASAAAPSATPIAVNCGPGQQALIRPSLLAGQTISQVECVAAAGAATMPAYATGAAPGMPVAYYDAPRLVEEPAVYRPARRVVRYQEAPARRDVRRSGRSWQKSAVIIGSSAGVGAGIGGALDGKKGALIGAAIGGGAATIWDQATRHK